MLTGITLASEPISCMATTSTTSYDDCVIGSSCLTRAGGPIMAGQAPDWTGPPGEFTRRDLWCHPRRHLAVRGGADTLTPVAGSESGPGLGSILLDVAHG
ncbi:hypothetical protein CBZ_24590 [Cellulomonas biazotea]|uniref:Uncharacterized protein n=1 Tax=Cellulomonas biazotea TaxID=1709 RepID=A0A402DTE6_9CELL|nr:hypothetical protein CBZ_24590 [Cellulomonas biazotea]